MVTVNNVFNNENMKVIASAGPYFIYEHQADLSVTPYSAESAYFMHQMNVRRRQLLVQLNNSSIKMQAGAMQWISGNVQVSSGVKGVGNFLGKMVKGAVSGESAVKPEYSGSGFVMLEPTYKHLLIEDVGSWGSGIVLDDGLFLACDAGIKETITRRSNVSSALLGGEGLFNLCLSGPGYAVLESPVPRSELYEFVLQDDVLKIDGNMAIAWSSSLQFTVETVTGNAIGSAATGEGFVNVYRGTGKVLMAPTNNAPIASTVNGPETTATSSQGIAGSIASSLFNA
ncbi:MAG TPA: transcriptional regulator [Lachnospiraceae bacterium]|nr:transcriptional regulator [Lachnospiraceae bacterium]